jgi:hypothetical protein
MTELTVEIYGTLIRFGSNFDVQGGGAGMTPVFITRIGHKLTAPSACGSNVCSTTPHVTEHAGSASLCHSSTRWAAPDCDRSPRSTGSIPKCSRRTS